MALFVGTLVLPIVSGGGAADAARYDVTEITPRQGRAGDQSPDLGAVGLDALNQKHDHMDGAMTLVANAAAGRTGKNPIDVAREKNIAVIANALVRAVIESAGARSRAVAAVRGVGGTVEAEYEDLVQALVPPAALETLAANPAVAYIREPARFIPDAITSEGVSASGAAAWQSQSFTGQNVKVGVIDSGFTGYQTRQAQGDLPANLTVVDFCGGQITPSGGEHGTAVAEVVYDMAPGVQLFLLCVDTEVQLGQAKEYAKTNGISILTMSVSWFNTSRGDGTGAASSPNATVADARANGIFWVNSAGNRAQQHYSASFIDSDGNQNHNYAANDNGNTVFLSVGQQMCVFLRWDNWPTTSQDLDLILATSSSGTTVAQSATRQTGTQKPTESLCYTNITGTSQNFAIVVRSFSVTQPVSFDLFNAPGPNLEYQVAAASVTEPASSPNAFAVGAICWQTDRFETYSSQGPTIDGRIKPDIAGQSVVSTASFPGPVSCPAGANGTGGFNGTSAANPHAAGAAALAKGANPSFTPAQLQAFLEGRAVDLGAPGKDNLFGIGKLQLGAPPVVVQCTPRPAVVLQTAIAGGRLAVTVQVTGSGNTLASLTFGNGPRIPTNALLDLPDGRTGLTGTPSYTPPPGTAQTTFWVRRQTAGLPVQVPFVVADGCGGWPTFVGGGTGPSAAGF